ncbi:tetratricopeptide repeat protein [Persicirhabdus sediminis]|uniref:Tetratricopeptide repeat-containing protein n=1 Tax=Persicirhabdus sediminis TaxID=454144 RepID=A0A8J7MCM0_9BACT|nr:hypothetical protein [Persicirhabdus sediminis]MBK1790611.1 hypothetical protein [Persicirhabdus sediminis]
MNKKLFVRLSSSLLFASLSLAQADEAADQPAEAVEINAKAAKYHKVLSKRPNSGHVFDRFCDAWLDTHSNQQLEAYLIAAANDKSPASQLLLAYFYQRQGEDHKALEVLKKSLIDHPENQAIRIQQAKTLAKLLAFDAAVAELDIAAKTAEHDDKLEILQLRGKFLARCGRYEEAQQTWTEILKTDASDEELVENILEAQIAEGLFEQALATSDIQLKQTRDAYQNVLHTLRRGDIYQRSGDVQKAIDTYTSTLDSVGEGSWLEREILAQLHEIFRRDDDFESLVTLYEKLTSEHPQRVGIKKAHTQLLSQLERHDEAETLLREILKITPGDRSNREELINILAKARKYHEAITEIKALLELAPDDSKLWLTLANIYHLANQSDEISASLAKYLELEDHSENSYLTAASLMVKYELFQQAEQYLTAAAKKYPDSIECKKSYARLLIKLDRKDEAIAIWQDLILTGSKDTVMRQTQTLRSIGEAELSYELLQKRADEFMTDINFASYVCNQARQQKDLDSAKIWAYRVLKLAKHFDEIRQSVALTSKVIVQADAELAEINHLENIDSASIAELWLLARLQELQAESSKALETLQRIREQDETIAFLATADFYEQRDEIQLACEVLEQLIASPKGKRPLYIKQIVRLYRSIENHEAALSHIAEWKILAPGEKFPWFIEAEIYQLENQLEKAVSTLAKASLLFSDDNADINNKLASVYESDAQFANAKRIYWKLYEQAETSNQKLSYIPSLARVADHMGQTQELLESFTERRKSNERSVEPILALAEIHRFNEDYEERRKFMIEAAQLRPDDVKILHLIADIEEREGDVERAIQTLDRAIKVDKSSKSKQLLAEVYMRNYELEKGIGILHELEIGLDSNPRQIEKLTLSIASNGDYELALNYLAEHRIQHADDYRLAFLQAKLQIELAEPELAIQSLLEARAIQSEIDKLTPLISDASFKEQSQQMANFTGTSEDYIVYDSLSRLIFNNRSNRQGGPSLSTLPGSLKEKDAFAEAGIILLLEQTDDEKVSQLAKNLKAEGLYKLDLRRELMKMWHSNSGDVSSLKEFALAHPEETVALALAASFEIIMASFKEGQIDEEFLAYVNKHLDGMPTNTRIMLTGNFLCYGEDQNNPLAWKMYLNDIDLEKVDHDALATTFTFITSQAKTRELSTEVRSLINDFALKIALNNEGKTISWFMRTQLITNSLLLAIETENADDFIALTNNILHEYDAKKAANQNPFSHRSRHNTNGFSVPEFPPKIITNLPLSLLGLIQQNEQSTYFNMGDYSDVSLNELSLNSIQIRQVESDRLQLLLAHFYKNESLTKSLIEALESSEKLSFSDYQYLAGYYCKSDRAKALDLLIQANQLGLTRAERKQLDQQIVAIALELKESDEPNFTSRSDRAKQAALRLRRQRWANAEARNYLISALESFGLQKEADLETIKNSPKSNSYSSSRQHTQTNTQDLIKELESALADKNQDKLKRLIVRELRLLTKANVDWQYSRRQENLVKFIQQRKLEDKVKKFMHPSEDSSNQKVVEYALTLDLLGERQEALEKLDPIIKEGSKDQDLLLRYVIMLPTDRSSEAAEIIVNRIQRSKHDSLAKMLESAFDRAEDESLEKWMNITQVCVESLELEQKSNNRIQASWPNRLIGNFTTSLRYDNLTVPSILSSEYLITNNKDELELRQQKLKISRDFLKLCMNFSSSAKDAFKQYHASLIATSELDQLDIKIAQLAHLTSIQKNQGNTYAYYSSSDTNKGKTPIEYLLAEAIQAGSDQAFPAEHLEKITRSNKPYSKALIEAIEKIDANDDEFEAYLKANINDKLNYSGSDTKSDLALKLCLAKGQRSKSLEGLWMNYGEIKSNQMRMHQYSQMLQTQSPSYIASHLPSNSDDMRLLLEKVIENIILPREDMSAFLAEERKNDYQQNKITDYQRVSMLTEWLSLIAQHTNSLAENANFHRLLIDLGIPKKILSHYELSENLPSQQFTTLNELLASYDTAGFGEMLTDEELMIAGSGASAYYGIDLYLDHIGDQVTTSQLVNKSLIESELNKQAEHHQVFLRCVCLYTKAPSKKKQRWVVELMNAHHQHLSKLSAEGTIWFTSSILTKAIDIKSKPNLKGLTPEASNCLHALLNKSNEKSGEQLSELLEKEQLFTKSELESTLNTFEKGASSLYQKDKQAYFSMASKLVRSARKIDSEIKLDDYGHPIFGQYQKNNEADTITKIVNSVKSKQIGTHAQMLSEWLNDPSAADIELNLAMIHAAGKEIATLNYAIHGSSYSMWRRMREFEQVVELYEALPPENEKLNALILMRYYLERVGVCLHIQEEYLNYCEQKLAEKDTPIRRALCTGILVNLIENYGPEWSAKSVSHVSHFYEYFDNKQDRLLFTQILADEGGDIFHYDKFAELAESILMEQVTAQGLDAVSAKSITRLLLNNAKVKDKTSYAQLFTQTKSQLRKARSNNRRSSSSSSAVRYNQDYAGAEHFLLALALASGDKDDVKYVLSAYSPAKLQNNQFVTCLLLRHGLVAEAHKIWGNWNSSEQLNLTITGSNIGLLDSDLEKSLEAFVALDPDDFNRHALRDYYLIRAHGLNADTQPSIGYEAIHKEFIEGKMATAPYSIDTKKTLMNSLKLYPYNENSARLDNKNCDKLLAISKEIYQYELDKYKGGIRTTRGNSNKIAVSIALKDILLTQGEEKYVETVLAINTENKKQKIYHLNYSLIAANYVLQDRLFDAILADDRAAIEKLRIILKPLAEQCMTDGYYYVRAWVLPVPLYGIACAYTNHADEFSQLVKAHEEHTKDKVVGTYTYLALANSIYKGDKLFAEKNRELCKQIFEKLISSSHDGLFDKKFLPAHNYRGLRYYESWGCLPSDFVIELYDYAITLDANNADLHNAKAKIYSRNGSYSEAEVSYRSALQIAQKQNNKHQIGLFMFSIAECLKQQGQTKAAIDYAQSIPEDHRNKLVKNKLKTVVSKWQQEIK